MFTLRPSIFGNGHEIHLVNYWTLSEGTHSQKRYYGLKYTFSPLGEVSTSKYACRVTRRVCGFINERPSPHTNKTAIWERIDVPLTIETDLTKHLTEIVCDVDKGFLDTLRLCDMGEHWFARFSHPDHLDGYRLGHQVEATR